MKREKGKKNWVGGKRVDKKTSSYKPTELIQKKNLGQGKSIFLKVAKKPTNFRMEEEKQRVFGGKRKRKRRKKGEGTEKVQVKEKKLRI